MRKNPNVTLDSTGDHSYTVINFTSPLVKAWIFNNQDVFSFLTETVGFEISEKNFFDFVAKEIDDTHVLVELDDNKGVVDNLIIILSNMYIEDGDKSFFAFLKSNKKRIENEASGGIYYVSCDEYEDWPIIDGVSIKNGEVMHYYFELMDDDSIDRDALEKVVPNSCNIEGCYTPQFDLKFYTPHIIEKIYSDCYIGEDDADDEDW